MLPGLAGMAGFTSSASGLPNLLGNGTFTTSTGWTLGSGWTISGGELNGSVVSSGQATYPLTLVAKKIYRVRYYISRTSGSVIDITGAGQGSSYTPPSGVSNPDLKVVGGGGNFGFASVGATFTGAIDDVIVNEVGTVVVTLNPSDKHADITLSSNDSVATKGGTANHRLVRATTGINAATANHYFEFQTTTSTGNDLMIGVANSSAPLTSYPGSDANGWAYYQSSGNKFTGGSGSAYGTSSAGTGVYQVWLKGNGSSASIWVGKNNTVFNSGDPVAGTGAMFTGLTGTLYPALGLQTSGYAGRATFHEELLTYSPRSGFSAWDS